MNRGVKLISVGAAMLLVATIAIAKKSGKPGGGPQPVTQKVVITGDVHSGVDPVDIGVKVWSWPATQLILPGDVYSAMADLLLELKDPDGDPAPEYPPQDGLWYGAARVVNKDARFDYDFDNKECRAVTWSDLQDLPLDEGVCRYSLVVSSGGTYDRKAGTWTFVNLPAVLVDYNAGPIAVTDVPVTFWIEPAL